MRTARAALLTATVLLAACRPRTAEGDGAAAVGAAAKPTAPAQGGVGATDAKATSPAPAASPLP